MVLCKRTTNNHRYCELNNTDKFFGEHGWRNGEKTRLPPMWPGFESWRGRHVWFKFVVGSLPCSERFFSVLPFSPSLKTNKNTHRHVSTSSYELLSAPWVNKLQFNTIIHFNYLAEVIEAAVTPDWIFIHTFSTV